jgi:hypothetical protein
VGGVCLKASGEFTFDFVSIQIAEAETDLNAFFLKKAIRAINL